MTPRFTIGADATIVGSQFFVADDSNQNPKLSGYYYINTHAAYALTEHLQLIAIINNITNNHYATYGTFYDTDTSAANVNATLANNTSNANALTVAQPLSVFGGIKLTF